MSWLHRSLDEAIEMLAAVSVAAQEKRANFADTAAGYLNKGLDFIGKNPTHPGVLAGGGALAGGLLGGLTSYGQDEDDRNTPGSALTGALAGGAIGGGLGLFAQGSPETAQQIGGLAHDAVQGGRDFLNSALHPPVPGPPGAGGGTPPPSMNAVQGALGKAQAGIGSLSKTLHKPGVIWPTVGIGAADVSAQGKTIYDTAHGMMPSVDHDYLTRGLSKALRPAPEKGVGAMMPDSGRIYYSDAQKKLLTELSGGSDANKLRAMHQAYQGRPVDVRWNEDLPAKDMLKAPGGAQSVARSGTLDPNVVQRIARSGGMGPQSHGMSERILKFLDRDGTNNPMQGSGYRFVPGEAGTPGTPASPYGLGGPGTAGTAATLDEVVAAPGWRAGLARVANRARPTSLLARGAMRAPLYAAPAVYDYMMNRYRPQPMNPADMLNEQAAQGR